MVTLTLWIVLSLIFTSIVWRAAAPTTANRTETIGKITLPGLFILAFLIRIVLATGYSGFTGDIGCFSSWADRMVKLGPSGFYADDFFADYPPLYLYCLWLIGGIRNLLSLQTYSPAHLILLKLPSILSDLGIGYIIYRTASKRVSPRSALGLAAIFLFQPVVILNSCIWGQVDAILTLLLLIICASLEKGMFLPAFLAYGAGVLFKPQMLVFTPILILAVINRVQGNRGKNPLRALIRPAVYMLITIVLMLAVSLPFGLTDVLSQYLDTVSSYPYASVNAYNFWAGIGLNWYPQETTILGIPCTVFGSIAIICAAIFSLFIGIKMKRSRGRFSFMGAFLIITVFTFSVRMHERYLYPVMALLLFSYPGLASGQLRAQNGSVPDLTAEYTLPFTLRLLYPIVFMAFICCHFYNTAHVFYFYSPGNYTSADPVIILTGLGTTLCAVLFYIMTARILKGGEKAVPATAKRPGILSLASGQPASPALEIPAKKTKMTGLDLILLALIMIVYSFFALHDLGDTHAPETYEDIISGAPVSLTFPDSHPVTSMAYYIGPEHDRVFNVSCASSADSADPVETTDADITFENVFTWTVIDLPAQSRSVSLTLTDGTARIFELVFLDENGSKVLPVNSEDHPALFDEESGYPDAITFRSRMYFDEIYHARCAYEFIEGMRSYENTHPPLGKAFISLGVRICGMNPFGWRIAGVIFGIMMLPMLYLFAKKLTGDTPLSALSCFIFAFDFMHFTQTRIATIDTFVVFFIICMYYFLYLYLSQDLATARIASLMIALALCGISMGLGVSCKWTGVYAGLGMGILFLLHLKRAYDLDTSGAVKKKTGTIIPFCVVFFIPVPAVIYLLSYIPFRDGLQSGLLTRALNNQFDMLSYHSNLKATHHYASPFYEWPFIIRPIRYYTGIVSGTVREGISALGSPPVWWTGIPAFLYMIVLYIRKKDRRALFLIIGYLSQYLPWFAVTRTTFIYHYFPSVVFVVLMIGYGFLNLKAVMNKKVYYTIIALYAASVFGLFLLFYPVLSGQPVELSYVKSFLRWFKNWTFVD